MIARIVLTIQEPGLRGELRKALAGPDVIVDAVSGRTRLWERLARRSADLVILSRSLLPAPETKMVGALRELPDSPAVVVVSREEDPEAHARLLAAGCDAVLHGGVSARAFRDVVQAILARRAAVITRAASDAGDMAQARLSDFVSQSPAMQAFMDVVRRVVPTDVSLLILGETGVGKERLAQAMHAEGPRANGPFVPVNCAALPESLLESELFGHEKGAFTGASQARRGRFELAHGGTVFLDEIGEMPYHLQVKLLRVLQDHQVQPIGGERTMTVDVRVMAASNRNLGAAVEAGDFRRDLYYRLGVVSLTIPPLRERREDIPVLVDSYLAYLQPRIGCGVEGVTEEAMTALVNCHWPGNVREMINVLERAMLLCDGREIGVGDLPAGITGALQEKLLPLARAPGREGEDALPASWLGKPWSEVREELLGRLERAYFAGLLETTGGRVGETAELAGIRPRSLYDKMKRYGLRKEDFRAGRDTE